MAEGEDHLRDALGQIANFQPRMVETLRNKEIVFDSIGTDPTNWQHVAFSIYTVLCEIDSIARAALSYAPEPPPGGGGGGNTNN